MLFHGFVFAPVKVPVLSLSNDLRRGHGNLSAPSYQVAFDHDVPHSKKKTNPGHFLMDIGGKNPDAERNKCSEFPVCSWILLNCLFLSYKQDLKLLVKDVFCI